jgi:hypothetical protein
MLEKQIKGKIDSWGIRWYLSVFLQGGLTLYPVQTLVQNIGFDGSGTHCRRPNGTTAGQLLTNPVRTLPEVHMDSENAKQLARFIASEKSLFNKIMKRLKFRRI